MDFNWAIEQLRAGKKITRQNDDGFEYLAICKEDLFENSSHIYIKIVYRKNRSSSLTLMPATNKFISLDDIASQNWKLYEEKKQHGQRKKYEQRK
ncbi:MAG TPA: hypothetical protein VMX17_01940 [Candidatus Glassbacteria bacterium]|nr:hypothetical protein [Candidatus Glassbacteria bacterium]